MRVLVTGATGNVGAAALAALTRRGIDAIGAGRRPPEPTDAPPMRRLDFTAPESFAPALAGVDRLFLVRPPQISDVGPTLNALVDAGRETLQHVVFLSVSGAASNPVIPHAKVEKHLRGAGIPWTFLRAGFFAQNLCGPYRQDIAEDDRIYVPAGQRGVAWVDTRDLGEAGAAAFEQPEARGAAWTLTGAESRSFPEVATLLSAELGRPIRYEPASIVGYLRHLRGRGMPWDAAAVYTALHTAIRMGAEEAVDPTLERVLGRRPRTIQDTIRDHLALWQP